MIFSIYVSLMKYSLSMTIESRFIGIENYIEVLQWPLFLNAIQVTLSFMCMAMIPEFFIGLAIALVYNQEIKGKNVFRTIMLLPMMLTPSIVGLIWKFMLNQELGIINYILGTMGLPRPAWLGDPVLALPSTALVDIWQWTPFMALIFLAGLQSLPNEPFEAAYVDGATKWQVFRHVTLPMLKPVISVAVLLRGLDAFRVFDAIYLLTWGGPANRTEVGTLFNWRIAFQYFDFGRASALSFILQAVAMIFAVMFLSVTRWEERA